MNSSIREEALKINWQKMEEVINFYESNQLYFNNYKTISSPDSIIEIIQIKQRYIEALVKYYPFLVPQLVNS